MVLKSTEYIVVGHLDSQRTGSMCTEDKKTKERDLFVEPIRQPEENYIFSKFLCHRNIYCFPVHWRLEHTKRRGLFNLLNENPQDSKKKNPLLTHIP